MGEGVCEGGADAEGSACVVDEVDGPALEADLIAVQTLRQLAVPAARAKRKSRRCMKGTFSITRLREYQAICVPNTVKGIKGEGRLRVTCRSGAGMEPFRGWARVSGVTCVGLSGWALAATGGEGLPKPVNGVADGA